MMARIEDDGNGRLAQAKAIAATLRLFVDPGHVGEIRVIGSGAPFGMYFGHEDIDRAAALTANYSLTAKGVYVVMNAIGAALSDRPKLITTNVLTKDADIVRRKKLLIDFDPSSPERGPNDSATDAEKDAARQKMVEVDSWLDEQGWPAPIIADSGNGWHLLFAIDLPNDDPSHRLIRDFLNALSKRFSDDQVAVDISVHNASRITKLYGTLARKGENRKDRPHRPSKLLSVPEDIGGVSPELIASAIKAALVESTSATTDVSMFDRPATAVSHINGDAHTPTPPKLILPETFPVGGRHEMLVRAAGAVRSIGMGEAEILETLRLLNRTRCGGDKLDDELQKIARDYAVKDVNVPMKALIEGRGESRPPTPFRLNLITSEQFAAENYRQHFLIKRVLVEGQPCVLGGPKKVLKTSLLVDLALSLGTGTPLLGDPDFGVAEPVNVLMLSGESGGYTLQETAQRIALARGRLLSTARIFWGFNLPQLGNVTHLEELAKQIREHEIKVAIIDPMYLCLLAVGENINITSNVFGMGALLRGISEIMSETGCTPIIAHHTRKGDRNNLFGVPDLEDLSGSGFAEWARQWILLNRREAYEAGTGEHRLWLNVGGSAGHSGTWALDINEGTIDEHGSGRTWEVSVLKATEAVQRSQAAKESAREQRDHAKQNQQREAIIKAYALFPDGETGRTIREAAGISSAKFGVINAELLAEGIIEACHITKNKRDEAAFRLLKSSRWYGGAIICPAGTVPPVPPAVRGGGTHSPPLGGVSHPPPPRGDTATANRIGNRDR